MGASINPGAVQFLSPDPLAAASPAQASNAYGYGATNPTSFTDPSGLMIGGDRGTGTTDDRMLYVAAAGRASNADWSPKKAWNGFAGGLNGGFTSLKDTATAGDDFVQRFGGPLGLVAVARDSFWDNAHSFLEQHGGADTSATNYRNATSDGATGVTVATMFVGGAGLGKAARFASGFLRQGTKAATAAAEDAARLASRTDELTGALDPIAQNRRTSAVMSTREGTDVLAGGGRDLSRDQRALARTDDVLGRMPGAHAEITAMDAAAKAGLTPWQMAVSRAICPACQAAIEESGGTVAPGGLFASWPS